MPIGDSKVNVKFYVEDADGTYIEIHNAWEHIKTQLIEAFDPGFNEWVVNLFTFYKKLPAEMRFPKKHRHQASIDRKKRKQRRKSLKVLISASTMDDVVITK